MHAITHAREAGAAVVHTLLEGRPNACDVVRLESARFTPLAELYYLIAETRDFPTEPPEGPLTFEGVHLRRACATVLCLWTKLTRRRSTVRHWMESVRPETFWRDMRRGSGTCPSHWFLIRHQDRDVGCLLLADYADHGNCELTYMGLIPSSRGNGWGLQVTRHAQWIARGLGRERLVLAVDSTNQPARDMYAAAGFRGWDRRHVYMRVLER